jgi:hypothetical protein
MSVETKCYDVGQLCAKAAPLQALGVQTFVLQSESQIEDEDENDGWPLTLRLA